MPISDFLIAISLWGILSLIICVLTVKYIIEKTNYEELSFLVVPVWVLLSILTLGIYLSY